METAVRDNDMILLFDYYNTYSEDLFSSFRTAGYTCPAMVIEEDGFLPEGIQSVYGYFLGDFASSDKNPGKPRYFNQITVPEYWEISATNRSGKVQDLYKERGRIYYAKPEHKRLVKVVDWLDEKGVVRSSDHYNRYGALYARTVFNAKGQKVNKTYFSAEGQEVIVENFVTGDIILNQGEQIHFFRNKTDFVVHVLKEAGYGHKRLFFNSLSTPFFVSQRMPAEGKGDILFWQEPTGSEIPGNMQVILQGQSTRANQIMVQMNSSYERLLALGADAKIVHKLGFIYNYEAENKHRPAALICTNSDRIEKLKELVEALPQLQFKIAAITEMSSKLMSMGSYPNVSLYPGAKTSVIEDLFDECDFYLDVNHENEIVSALRRAFLHNQLILGFQETLHNADYVAKPHIHKAVDYENMVEQLKILLADNEKLEEHLAVQRANALSETSEKYVF